jgi:hypothetical protein
MNSYIQPSFATAEAAAIDVAAAAAAAISLNAQASSTEAPMFVMDHAWVPPPNKAQLLQEQHLEKQKNSQLFL